MATNPSGLTSLAGMATGLDTNSIVSQLTQLRRSPAIKLGYQLEVNTARREGLQEVSNLLSSLRSRAQALKNDTLWTSSQSVSVSDDKLASVSRTSNSAVGASTISVTALARAEQKRADTSFVAALEDDTLTVQVGSGAAKQVSLSAGDALDTIASKINAVSGIGVYASVISGRLYLSGKSSGAENTISLTSTGSTAAAMNLSTSLSASDASYSLNGGPVQTSSSNTVTDALGGLSITFKSTGSFGITVSGGDVSGEAVADKLSEYVDAYNAAVRGIRSRTSERPVSSPANAVERRRGALFSDVTLGSIGSSLANWTTRVNSSLATGFQSFSDLGISTAAAGSAGAISGELTFDREAFLSRFAENPAEMKLAVTRVTGSASSEGLSQWTERQLEAMIGASGTLAVAIKGRDSQGKLLTERQARINERADRYSANLRRQYNALESAMSTLNSQGSSISSALARL